RHDPLRSAARLSRATWVPTGTLALSLALPYVWMHFLWHYAAVLDMVWYPRSIRWMAQVSPQPVWKVFIALRPWWWTYTVAWCAVLAAVAWSVVRLKPRQRGLTLALLVLSQIGIRLRFFGQSFIDFAHEPTNEIVILNFLWNVISVFVAIPLSIVVGGYRQNPRSTPKGNP
ncbi:MAG TPA: hypothetical protein VEV20_15010, partial [Burkholderiales bacterium]|nr:hypothetical protein [Burkholderiales bacterium]